MARIHILQSSGVNTYEVVVHDATPGGNNSAGVSWATALKNSGDRISRMPIGTGPGQITNAESNAVIAGTTIEAIAQFQDDPAWSAAERNAAIDSMATQLIAEMQAQFQRQLKWFGATRS